MKLYAICWKLPDHPDAGWEPAVGDVAPMLLEARDKPAQAFFWHEEEARRAFEKHVARLDSEYDRDGSETDEQIRKYIGQAWSVQEYDVPDALSRFGDAVRAAAVELYEAGAYADTAEPAAEEKAVAAFLDRIGAG